MLTEKQKPWKADVRKRRRGGGALAKLPREENAGIKLERVARTTAPMAPRPSSALWWGEF